MPLEWAVSCYRAFIELTPQLGIIKNASFVALIKRHHAGKISTKQITQVRLAET